MFLLPVGVMPTQQTDLSSESAGLAGAAGLYSREGDTHFDSGAFQEAEASYERALNVLQDQGPEWRRQVAALKCKVLIARLGSLRGGQRAEPASAAP